MARRFFIVDDDQAIIEFMTLMLESAGHEVSSCLAGTEAIPKIATQKPDCILTDLMMAELDGLQLCQEIRSRPNMSDAVVIVVSARQHPYRQDRARESGADGYVVKPLSADTFVGNIETIIQNTGRP